MKVILKRKSKLDTIKLGGLSWSKDGDVYVNENVSKEQLAQLKAGYGDEIFDTVETKAKAPAKRKPRAKAKK